MILDRTMAQVRQELSLRGLILGVAITLVFTAANVYFGLKAGLTFATSIPAAVISMAILRGFSGSSIQENNIVQTVASAAGTLSAIIFVLPGLVMIGWWTGFPYWTSFIICALGGMLGVMYSIPLRRALVSHSDLPYPEGVACAEVLKVGARGGEHSAADAAGEPARGLLAILVGSISSALFALIIATQIFAGDVTRYFRVGNRNGVSGFDFGLSFALFAVGHLVGVWTGMAMLARRADRLGRRRAAPFRAAGGRRNARTHCDGRVARPGAFHRRRHDCRGGVLEPDPTRRPREHRPRFRDGCLARPARRSTRHRCRAPNRTFRSGSSRWSRQRAWCRSPGCSAARRRAAASVPSCRCSFVGGVAYIVLMSFFVAAVCGYMAGLIGASNSPLSGVGIPVVVGAALLLALFVKPLMPPAAGPALVAFALFVTAVVFAAATISNDNLQDLKTGQLVDATPWRQQVALLVGVVAGAAVIPPVLNLLQRAYGFAGAPGVDSIHALPAPQAALFSALARGVLQGNLQWNLIGAGALIGIVSIAVDEALKRRGSASLPPLAVGMGIYLPMSTTLPIVAGTIAGWWFDRRAERGPHPGETKQLGVLLASGMIVGESLIGVILAAIVVFSGKDAPLALVGERFETASVWIGVAAFAASIAALYAWVGRLRR